MANYKVMCDELWSRTVWVEADTPEEAYEIAFNDEDTVWNSPNYYADAGWYIYDEDNDIVLEGN